MSLATTLSSSSSAPAEAAAKPRSAASSATTAAAGNRRGPGSGAAGDFASLLRGQSALDDEAAVNSAGGNRTADDKPATADDEASDASAATGADNRKLPTKPQPGADDLTPLLQPWIRPLAAEAATGAARDTGGRLNALARAMRQGSEWPGPDSAEATRPGTVGKPGTAPGAEPAPGLAEAGSLPAVVATEPAAAVPDGSLPSLLAAGESSAAPAAPLHPAAAEAPAPLPEARATLEPTPGTPAFTEALGVQLSTWLEAGVQHAVLELHPEDLGPIDVRISMRDGDTRVELGALVDSTRAALSEAMPQLAEALGDVGLSLSGGSVSDQTAGGFAQPGGSGDERRLLSSAASLARAFGRTEGDGADAADPAMGRRPVAARGLLDLYA